MAIYEYQCEHCQKLEETQIHFEVGPDCPNCFRTMKRVWSSPAVHFKGKGFYSTGG
ncbi:MAG: hypothetical protein EBT95_00175 [Verrucomicrobia bacterium]|nr:hypothetical protein [Verrucomicrobiota bacterium]